MCIRCITRMLLNQPDIGDVYTWGWAGGHEDAKYQETPRAVKRLMLIKALHNNRTVAIRASKHHSIILQGTLTASLTDCTQYKHQCQVIPMCLEP
jgi:hypothetical protein